MAAVTPSKITQESVGSLTLIVATFTSVNDADTWTSGINGTKFQIFAQTDNPTTQAAAGITVAESSGVFTFYPGENGAAGKLLVFK